MIQKSLLALFACLGALSCVGESAEESVVRGVVVDVQDGEALIGVRVEGPRGTRAVTDPRGRFVLKGLRVGDEGPQGLAIPRPSRTSRDPLERVQKRGQPKYEGTIASKISGLMK